MVVAQHEMAGPRAPPHPGQHCRGSSAGVAAALAGTTEKAGSTITFKGLDGTTDRIVGSFDAENNRTGAVLDGS